MNIVGNDKVSWELGARISVLGKDRRLVEKVLGQDGNDGLTATHKILLISE